MTELDLRIIFVGDFGIVCMGKGQHTPVYIGNGKQGLSNLRRIIYSNWIKWVIVEVHSIQQILPKVVQLFNQLQILVRGYN